MTGRRALWALAGVLVWATGFYVSWLLRDAAWYYRDTAGMLLGSAGAGMLAISLFHPELWRPR